MLYAGMVLVIARSELFVVCAYFSLVSPQKSERRVIVETRRGAGFGNSG
jgi:hypothetical protein